MRQRFGPDPGPDIPAPIGSSIRHSPRAARGGFDFRLPAEALVEFQTQSRKVRVRCHDREADVFEKIGSQHALFDRAVPSTATAGDNSPGNLSSSAISVTAEV